MPTGGLDISDLQITLTRKVGTVTGNVVTVDDKPTRDATVVLFAEDAALGERRRATFAVPRPTIDGTFSITGLPADTYLAVVREFVADGEWESKEFLEAARQDGSGSRCRAAAVNKSDAETAIAAVKLRQGPAP